MAKAEKKACTHENLTVHAAVVGINDPKTGARFTELVSLRVNCANEECGRRMMFKGAPHDLNLEAPTTDASKTEIRLPFVPEPLVVVPVRA